ncbi:MAG: ABC transporter ATP-binding protein [Burkholderiales bacterium]
MSEIALRFAQVEKRYSGVPVVSGFSLDVRRGEFFGLVGVNGAGKTTLIKCLLDFCDADGGAIEIFSVPHTTTSARARIAYLPERFNPPFFLTGREFLHYMLGLHRARYDEAEAVRVLEALDLEPAALGRAARAYSKGMMQKLGLAACLLSGKDLYVLDEPTGGLDPKARALLKGELKALRRSGRTVFFTSHTLADVADLCDRLAVMHGGRLRFAGTPGELTARTGTSGLEQAFLACIAE